MGFELDKDRLRRGLRRVLQRFPHLIASPSEWARKAKLAPSTVNKFLNGDPDHTLSLTTLGKLADAVGLPPEEFFLILWAHDPSPAMLPEAAELVSLQARFSAAKRQALLETARSLAGDPPVQASRRGKQGAALRVGQLPKRQKKLD